MIKKYVAFTLPVFLAVILGAYFFIADAYLLSHEFEPPLLMPLLNVLFLGVSSFGVAILAAGSYRRTGRSNLVLLGGGALVFGSATIASGWFVHLAGGINDAVTIFSCGVLLTGILYFAGTIADFMDLAPEKDPARRRRILWVGYGGAGSATALIVAAALFHWMPVFFVQHVGPSMVRQTVLGVSIVLLLYAGFYLAALYFKSRTDFFFWHALGFLFMAEGLLGEMLSETVGGIINWTGRLALYTGGICLLVAVIGIFRKRSPQEVLGAVFTKPRELHASLFESSLEGILLARRDGMILDANAAAGRLLGYPPGQIRNRMLEDLFHPLSEGLEAFRDELAARGQARAELALNHRDGHLVEVDITSAFFDDPLGERLEVLSFQDIGAHKRSQQALRASEERYRTLFESIDEGFCIIEMLFDSGGKPVDYRFLEVNPAFERQIGLYDAVGRSMRELAPQHEAYWYETYGRIALTGEPERFVHQAMQLGRWFDVYAFRIGRPQERRVAVLFEDITENRRIEEQLHKALAEADEGRRLLEALMEHIPLGIAIADAPDARIRAVSRAGSESVGKPREQIEGIPLERHIENWQIYLADGVTLADNQALPLTRATHGALVENEEWVIGRPDGTRIPILCTAAPIRDARGNITGGVIGWQDITERKRMEESLRQLNATLEQQVAERTQLAETRARQLQALAVELIEAEERERRRISRLLHEDLQQLIAAAKFELEAYQLNAPPDPILSGIQELLEQSIGKSRRLSHELSPMVLDHSGLIAALRWLVRHVQEQFGLQVDLEAEAEQACTVALKIFVFRATQELLFNVVKHSGVNAARIGLSCSGQRLSISVSDDGRGFDPGILNSFGAEHGFGLLSLRERAQYIGGVLDIQSAPGRGSRIMLTVPIEPSPSESAEVVSEIGRPSDILTVLEQSTRTKSIRVMFVDDHQIMRQGLVRLITAQPGIELAGEAANGREAVDLAQHLRPDVVLMDISMPEMDGIEATRRIKELYPDMRVLGLSMHEDDQLTNAIVQAGAEALVSKTASPAELLKAIYGIDPVMPDGKSPSG